LRYVAVGALFAATLSAQAQIPTFEAVSVKRLPPDTRPSFQPSAGFRFSGPLTLLIHQAFLVGSEWQYSQIPDWARTESYEVIGTYKPGTPTPTPAERSAMVRAVLADRFKLRTHEEPRELPVYSLGFAREDKQLGPGIQGPLTEDCAAVEAAAFAEARANGQPPPRPLPGEAPRRCFLAFQLPHVVGDLTMDALASLVQGLIREPVQNATGLAGYYHVDFTAGFDRGPSTAPTTADAPSPFTALPEQLGLKLERGRAEFQVIVIDRIERPSEN
jgi:uncharacterized protein (TIGR03435 family)